MKNFQVTDKDSGKTYWISRSLAVAGLIVATHPKSNELYFLLEKRGKGCPDNVGKYCFVCGYLDFDETREEALIREVHEELGLDISQYDIIEWYTNDDPKCDPKQNVTTRFIVSTEYTDIIEGLYSHEINCNTEERGGEKDEVENIVFLPLSKIYKMNSEDFAFNHKEIICEFVEDYYEIDSIDDLFDNNRVDNIEDEDEFTEEVEEEIQPVEEVKPKIRRKVIRK